MNSWTYCSLKENSISCKVNSVLIFNFSFKEDEGQFFVILLLQIWFDDVANVGPEEQGRGSGSG